MSINGMTVVDCDGHILEPKDLWDHYCDPTYRERVKNALSIEELPGGGVSICIEGIMHGGASTLGAYGLSTDHLQRRQRHWNPQEMTAGGFEPHARIKDMDKMEIDAALLYPSVCTMVGGIKDARIAYAACRAYNNWVTDYCHAYPARLFQIMIVPLQEVSFAVAEAERAAALGARGLVVRPCAYNGALLSDPQFDRFWAAAEALGLVVALHPFPSPDMEGTYQVVSHGRYGSDIRQFTDLCVFPMDNMLTFGRLMWFGVLDRHPNLKLGIMESNGTWIAMFLDRMEKRFHLHRGVTAIKTPPWDIFHRQCYVAFEGEERCLAYLAPLLQDQVLWSSDYPHLDTEVPAKLAENMAGVPRDIQAKILGENAMRLYRLDLGRS